MREFSTRRSVFCLALWCAPGVAWAGETPPPSAAAAKSEEPGPPPTPSVEPAVQARAEFEAGVGAFDASDFGAAADHFARAQALQPHPEVLLNLAQSELKAGRYAEAATHFHAYIQELAPQESAEARLGFTEARSYVAQVSIVLPEPIKVSLDGTELGTTFTRPLFVAPGTHRFTAGNTTKTVIATAGEELSVNLEPTKPEVSANGKQPETGRHPVSFPEWFIETPVAWAGAGVTAAGLIFSALSAGTATIRYEAAANSAQQIQSAYSVAGATGGTPCGPPALNATFAHACDVYSENKQAGKDWSAVSVVSLIVGVVAGAGTVAWYFIDPKVGSRGEAGPTAKLIPVLTPEYQSLTISGRF